MIRVESAPLVQGVEGNKNQEMKRIFTNRIALATAAVGVGLLAVAFHFNVNPVDGGAIRGGIQHHPWILLPLGVTTTPAMFMALLVLGVFAADMDQPYGYYAVSFACQFLLFFMLGLALSGTAGFIRRRTRHK